MATRQGPRPIPVTVDTFEACGGGGVGDAIGGVGGLANREPASSAGLFMVLIVVDLDGGSNQRKGCKGMHARLSAAEARTRDGLGPRRMRLVCQAGTADLQKPLQTTK